MTATPTKTVGRPMPGVPYCTRAPVLRSLRATEGAILSLFIRVLSV